MGGMPEHVEPTTGYRPPATGTAGASRGALTYRKFTRRPCGGPGAGSRLLALHLCCIMAIAFPATSNAYTPRRGAKTALPSRSEVTTPLGAAERLRLLALLRPRGAGGKPTPRPAFAGIREESLASMSSLDLSGLFTIDNDLTLLQFTPALKELKLHANRYLADAGLAHLGHCAQLQKLTLSFCPRITDKGCEVLGDLAALEHLDLSSNPQLTDKALYTMRGKTSTLKSLDLSRTAVRGTCLGYVEKSVGMTSVKLNECPMLTDTALRKLDKLTALKYVQVQACPRITDSGVRNLSYLGAVEHIDVSWNPGVTGIAWATLKKCASLKRLAINGTPMDDRMVPGLLKLEGLETLEMVGTKVTAAMAEALGKKLGGCRLIY